MIPVSLTGFTGYFLFIIPMFPLRILLVSLGILSLAISASVLNQIQEADIDKRWKEPRYRPLPSRKIKPQHACIIFLF